LRLCDGFRQELDETTAPSVINAKRCFQVSFEGPVRAVDLFERRFEVLGLSRQQNRGDFLRRVRTEKLRHCATVEVRQIVVLIHRFVRDAESHEQQRGRETGAVLAARAVDEQRVAFGFKRDRERLAIFLIVIDAEQTVLGDDSPFELVRRDRSGLDQLQHLQRASRQKAKLDALDRRSRRKAVGARLALHGSTEVDQRREP